MIELLTKIAALWVGQREKLISTGDELTTFVIKESLEFSAGDLSAKVIDDAYQRLEHYFDREYGGFGHAPKFPTPHQLTILLRYYVVKGEKKALAMVEKSLEQMYMGGILIISALAFPDILRIENGWFPILKKCFMIMLF